MSTSGEDKKSQLKHRFHPHSHSLSQSLAHSILPNPPLTQTCAISSFNFNNHNHNHTSNHRQLPPTFYNQTQPPIRAENQTTRYTKHATHKPNATEAPHLAAVNNCRYDSSLGLLTKKFVCLIEAADYGTLDLNKSAETLEVYTMIFPPSAHMNLISLAKYIYTCYPYICFYGQVQKRRIYDITNVLEGIGLIEKTSKNHIRWKGCNGHGAQELDYQLKRLKTEVENLYAEESALDDCIRQKQELIKNLEENENSQRYLFLTNEDILNLPCFQNQELIAIKAPKFSVVEVPDPDQELGFRHYKMTVRSATGPIYIYLLSKKGLKCKSDTIEQVKLIDPSWNGNHCKMRDMILSASEADLKNPEVLTSPGSEAFGIQEITPMEFKMDDDYWFESDAGVTLTDLWVNNNF
ncbi:transcription factor E2FC-like isoform X2 [Arachis ipaensis]|uniref:transcription factor E2FC-like isoform X2 n=1 Tax=Arachis ipaensis TaxID=130454 RepID=UPI0007AF3DF8|nr:transcription factor E2FC-like isoform X2 [Arachis ipaensis]